ncbi:hypothetical protein [Streptomyces albidoflavus]|nr:hypothetical protein [Streptomyces albidoflavus]
MKRSQWVQHTVTTKCVPDPAPLDAGTPIAAPANASAVARRTRNNTSP